MKTRVFNSSQQKNIYDLYRDPANKPFHSPGVPDDSTPSRSAFWLGYTNGMGTGNHTPFSAQSIEHAAFLAGKDIAEDEREAPGFGEEVRDFIGMFAQLGDQIRELTESPEAAFDAYHSGLSIWQKLDGKWQEVNIAKDTRNGIHQPRIGRGRYLGPLVECSLVDPRKTSHKLRKQTCNTKF